MKHGAFRTVRNGEVKIAGMKYRPQQHHMVYDGRLDGKRFLFGRYFAPWLSGGYEPFVSLWGTEEAAKTETTELGPECVDGCFPWVFWEVVK